MNHRSHIASWSVALALVLTAVPSSAAGAEMRPGTGEGEISQEQERGGITDGEGEDPNGDENSDDGERATDDSATDEGAIGPQQDENTPDSGTGGSPDVDDGATPTIVPLTDHAGEPTDLADDGSDGQQDGPRARRAPGAAAPSVLTDPIAAPRFVVAAFTWQEGTRLPEDAHLFLRVLEDSGWSDWLEVGADDAEHGRAGTDPFLTGGATAVQAQVTGTAAALPADLDLLLVPANPSGEAAALRDPAAPRVLPDASAQAQPREQSLGDVPPPQPPAPDATTLAPGVDIERPSVIGRAGWGADESLEEWDPENARLRAAVVHHTAGTNNYTRAESAGIVRGIYYYHAVQREWGDIGYNFLVDKYGQIFQGRKGTMAAPPGQMVVAGHARGFNTGSVGLSAMGDYSTVRAPQLILDRMNDVIAWQFGRSGIDPRSPSGFVSPGTAARPAGQNLPRIFAHRDVGDTTCPGDNIYRRISTMIGAVAERMPESNFLLANHPRNPSRDIRATDARPHLEVYIGDWDGDGRQTPMYRDGNRFDVYNRLDTTGPPDRTFRFGRATDAVVVGDWNGNGRDAVGARRGWRWLLSNTLSAGADRAFGFGRASDTPVVGDWNGNGRDTVGLRRAATWLLSNRLDSVVHHTFVFGRSSDTPLVGDWNGDGRDTAAVRRGRLQLVTNSHTRAADWSYTYGRASDVVLSGDWNGNGTSTIGVRRAV